MHYNKLLPLFGPVFALVKQFYAAQAVVITAIEFRQKIINAFEDINGGDLNRDVTVDSLCQAKYALVCFLDELVMRCDSPYRQEWMAHPLQLQLFGEHLGGEGFFTQLSVIRQGGLQQIDLLEIYYICLQLGFEGVYSLQGGEKLTALKKDLQKQIENARGEVKLILSPEVMPCESMAIKTSRQISFWVMGGVTAGICLLIYFIFSLLANHQADNAALVVHQLVNSLLLRNL